MKETATGGAVYSAIPNEPHPLAFGHPSARQFHQFPATNPPPAFRDADAIRSLDGQHIRQCIAKVSQAENRVPWPQSHQQQVDERASHSYQQVLRDGSLLPDCEQTFVPLQTYLFYADIEQCGGAQMTAFVQNHR